MESTNNNLPQEIMHFNWGAFLLNWIWGLMHKKYITLLYFPACLIPLIGPFAISLWFGFEGNKWAWESQKWESVEQFNLNQQKWVILWFILAILGCIITFNVIFVFLLIANMNI